MNFGDLFCRLNDQSINLKITSKETVMVFCHFDFLNRDYLYP